MCIESDTLRTLRNVVVKIVELKEVRSPSSAASLAAHLHSFAPPPLLPNSTRKKSLSAPSFFATALGKILPFFVV